MKLNENIKNFRTFQQITQQDLADMLGKSKSVISNWERGENSPDLDSCEQLCKIFKVTPNELFGWEENQEYLQFIKRIGDYQKKLSELRAQKDIIEKQIHDLEVKKFTEAPPIDFM